MPIVLLWLIYCGRHFLFSCSVLGSSRPCPVLAFFSSYSCCVCVCVCVKVRLIDLDQQHTQPNPISSIHSHPTRRHITSLTHKPPRRQHIAGHRSWPSMSKGPSLIALSGSLHTLSPRQTAKLPFSVIPATPTFHPFRLTPRNLLTPTHTHPATHHSNS